jgi:GNAT superfamily N-acetyltransferase
VGWCQLTPRDVLPRLDRAWRLKRVDDAPVWSLSCFYVRKGYRRKGARQALIAAALNAARRAKVPALEAYPLDAELTPSASSTGYASTFFRAGFKTVPRRVPPPRLCATIWRETGANKGNFRLQPAMIGHPELRADTRKSSVYALRLPLPRLGAGVRMPSPAPKFQHLKPAIRTTPGFRQPSRPR